MSGSCSSSITCCRSSPRSRTRRCRCASRAPRRPSEPRAPASLLERVGLGERLEHRPGAMSGGEQQRVAIARALVMQPTLLLADEPTGDLDEHTAETLHALLRQMHGERGLTSIIATHNPRLAAACDRVLRLEDGKLKRRSACGLSRVVSATAARLAAVPSQREVDGAAQLGKLEAGNWKLETGRATTRRSPPPRSRPACPGRSASRPRPSTSPAGSSRTLRRGPGRSLPSRGRCS